MEKRELTTKEELMDRMIVATERIIALENNARDNIETLLVISGRLSELSINVASAEEAIRKTRKVLKGPPYE